MADLFLGQGPTPTRARGLAQQRAQKDAEARKRRIAHGVACDLVRELECLVEALGGRLAQEPNNNDLFALFSAALDRLRESEAREAEFRP